MKEVETVQGLRDKLQETDNLLYLSDSVYGKRNIPAGSTYTRR